MALSKEELLNALSAPGVMDAEMRGRLLELVLQLPAPPPPRRQTFDEFLEAVDEDSMAEWVNGEVIMTSPAGAKHQEIVSFLHVVLRVYLESRQIGRLYLAPFVMRLEASAREPDLLFVSKEHLDRGKSTYLDGAADLVVEVTSPESRTRDRGDKFYEYQAADIAEYWLIDPESEQAEFYQLNEQGHYAVVQPDSLGIYRSPVLAGFPLRVAWLWQPPPILMALRELGLIS